MKTSTRSNKFYVGAMGSGVFFSCTVSLISLILCDYLPVPPWIALAPTVLAFMSLGVSSPGVPCMVAVVGVALTLAPVTASLAVGFPARQHQSAVVVQAAFRLAVAADLAIMLPAAFMSIVAGLVMRALCVDHVVPPTWRP